MTRLRKYGKRRRWRKKEIPARDALLEALADFAAGCKMHELPHWLAYPLRYKRDRTRVAHLYMGGAARSLCHRATRYEQIPDGRQIEVYEAADMEALHRPLCCECMRVAWVATGRPGRPPVWVVLKRGDHIVYQRVTEGTSDGQ